MCNEKGVMTDDKRFSVRFLKMKVSNGHNAMLQDNSLQLHLGVWGDWEDISTPSGRKQDDDESLDSQTSTCEGPIAIQVHTLGGVSQHVM